MNHFAKRIIPCLDVKDGRVVKGINFIGLKDAGDPVEVARRYNDEGADELCFLDITATHEQRGTLVETVKKVAKELFIPLTVGGGIRTIDDISTLLNAGCDKVSLNSAAISNPNLISEAANKFGAQCVVVAVDIKHSFTGNQPVAKLIKQLNNAIISANFTHALAKSLNLNDKELSECTQICAHKIAPKCKMQEAANGVNFASADADFAMVIKELSSMLSKSSSSTAKTLSKELLDQSFRVYIAGGRKDTGIDAFKWIKECEERGAGEILLTSMDADGTKDGYDLLPTAMIANSVNIPLIASGGAGSMEDIKDAFKAGADAALAASIFHFKEIEIDKLKSYLSQNDVAVRL
ncbi:hypothetical protein LBC_00780 [Campylobacter sp. 19-13652]|nr:hypothetical protein LBC_00780 [Campylobacter sp. 19-13652]